MRVAGIFMRSMLRVMFVTLVAVPMWASAAADAPRIAVLPLAGAAGGPLREKVAFALRAKLARDGTYDVIDGVVLKELTEAAGPPALAADAKAIQKLLADEMPTVIVWGELSGGSGEGVAGTLLQLKGVDLRRPTAPPIEISRKLAEATDLRLVTEEIVQKMPGVGKIERPNEEPVHEDATSKLLWSKNPNLVVNGNFSKAGGWTAIYQAEKYAVAIAAAKPAADKVNITANREPPAHNVLAMNLSRVCAENNGMACLSDAIAIKPNTRYRISFRYRSDGPTTHVFVKGYATAVDAAGKKSPQECFRTQVPPSGPTNGKWATVVCDVNPSHPTVDVETLRVDLYAYLAPGEVLWEDVELKEIGPMVEKGREAPASRPTTRPVGSK